MIYILHVLISYIFYIFIARHTNLVPRALVPHWQRNEGTGNLMPFESKFIGFALNWKLIVSYDIICLEHKDMYLVFLSFSTWSWMKINIEYTHTFWWCVFRTYIIHVFSNDSHVPLFTHTHLQKIIRNSKKMVRNFSVLISCKTQNWNSKYPLEFCVWESLYNPCCGP